MRYQQIKVLAARTQELADDGQWEVERECDTVKEAKDYAKYCLTDAHMQSAEASEPLAYAQVVADGEVLADFWRDE